MDLSSHTGPYSTQTSVYSSHVKMILKTVFSLFKWIVCRAKSLSVANRSSWQETVWGFLLFFFRQASLGLPFLLMSCHAMAFQGGNMFLCRRQPGQAGCDKGSYNQIRHVIKSSERPELARSTETQQRMKLFYKEQHKRSTPGRIDTHAL